MSIARRHSAGAVLDAVRSPMYVDGKARWVDTGARQPLPRNQPVFTRSLARLVLQHAKANSVAMTAAEAPAEHALTEHLALLTVFVRDTSALPCVPESNAETTDAVEHAERANRAQRARPTASVSLAANHNAKERSVDLTDVEANVASVLLTNIAATRVFA